MGPKSVGEGLESLREFQLAVAAAAARVPTPRNLSRKSPNERVDEDDDEGGSPLIFFPWKL